MRCRSSSPRVVKTIRLRRAGLEPWIHKTNIKVVTVTVAMVLIIIIIIIIILRLFTWYETRVLSLIQCQSGLFCSKQILKEHDFQPGLEGYLPVCCRIQLQYQDQKEEFSPKM